ncbi:MAG: hypothetical protein ABEJ68_09420 [Halobacteriaceae archaeon]
MFDDIFDEDETPAFEGSLTDVPKTTLRAFLAIVVLSQVGLFAVSLGVMLAGFRGQVNLGGALVAAGAVALTVAVVAYRRYAP